MISIEIKGLDKLRKALDSAPRDIAAEMKRSIYASLLILQMAARERVPKDMSNLAENIKPVMKGSFEGQLLADTKYALFVHEGTRPHFPPIDAIEPWARRHGIPAFLVARSIARKGTKPKPFMTWAKEAKANDINKIFENAINKIVAKLAS